MAEMADEVKVTLSKRNGEIKVFKEGLVKESGKDKDNLDALIGSLMRVQKRVNDALTEIVEDEKNITMNSSRNTSKDMNKDNDDDNDEEDDNDVDDDDDGGGGDDDNDGNYDHGNNNNLQLADKDSCEPVPKKPKSS